MSKLERGLSRLRRGPEAKLPLSAVLRGLADDESRTRVSVGDLFSVLGDRALGALLFVFAFPNVIPAPPGASTILGVPLLLLSAQLMFGFRPWLPKFVTRRSMPREAFARVVRHGTPWLERAEKMLRPRLSALAMPPVDYVVGGICLLLAVVIVMPIPLGNMAPGFAISLLALGILERDGLWVLAGLAVGLAATLLVWGVVAAMVKAALYLLAHLLQSEVDELL